MTKNGQARALYETWLREPQLTDSLKSELVSIANDDNAIEDRFYTDLSFGTGGLRGVLGAGTNRMNIFTVRRATRGLAQHVLNQGTDSARRGVAIGYDCRRMSTEFALEAGLVLAAAGVRAYVFEHLCPTPELSFAVRELGCVAGIMITASHNPPEYNGYKVYGADGGQLLPEAADMVTSEIEAVSDLFAIPLMSRADAEQAGHLHWLGAEMDEQYESRVVAGLVSPSVTAADRQALAAVYTPLHGTGSKPVRDVLTRAGYSPLIVAEQDAPDGEFPTVKSPNPEESSALTMAVKLALETGADIAFGTDPDADRVGVAVRTDDGVQLLTGNQVGGLLVDFLFETKLAEGTLPANPIVFKTIVTSELGARIALHYGAAVEDTLTGFKYIGERIGHYEGTGQYTFVFGYEESYGYLAAPFVRDKDAVQISLLICEMAAYHKRHGRTLVDALERLFQRVGYFREELVSATLPGVDGLAKIKQIMNELRSSSLAVSGLELDVVEDYESRRRTKLHSDETSPSVENIILPEADVLRYQFVGGAWLAVRPSGTEPKIKWYLGGTGTSAADCETSIQAMQSVVSNVMSKYQ